MRVATCRICGQFLRADGGAVLYAGDLVPAHHRNAGEPCPGADMEVHNAPGHRDPQGAPENGDELPVPGEPGSSIRVLEVWEDGASWEVKAQWIWRDGKSETETVSLQQWWGIVGFPAPMIRLERAGITRLWAIGNQSGVVESLPQLARIMRRLSARVHRSGCGVDNA